MLVLKLLRFIFQAPLLLLFLCSRKRPPKREKHTEDQVGASTSTEQGAYINPVCIRRRPTRTIGWAKMIWFCSSSFVRRPKSVHRQIFESRQLSKILSLSLLDRRVFDQGTDSRRTGSRRTGSRRTGIIFDHAGLSHEGLDSNNFVVAQHTTYFEDYLLRNLQFFDQLRRQLLPIVRPYHGVDCSPDYRFL